MTENDIRARFREVFNGKGNFMTPYTDSFGKRGKMIWELSHGDGFRNDPIYGITVIELPRTQRHDLSQCFPTREEALAYVKNDFQNEENANG